MIEVEQLTRRYGDLTAVDALSFQVAPGEVLGFLGPNGAGKTTTMKMLTGFLTPTSGTARILGHDVVADSLAARREVGYLPEGAPAWADMTPATLLDFCARTRGMHGSAARSAVDRVVAQLDLGDVLHQRIDALSKGFRRRVGLAQALLHDPRVLILDEPTDGLDPNQKHQVRGLIEALSEDKIVVVSTHILEEVEAVCSRALIIADGRLVADDTPARLAARSRWHGAIAVHLAEPVQDTAALAGLPGVATVEPVDASNTRWVVFPSAGDPRAGSQGSDPREPGADGLDLLHAVRAAATEAGWTLEELFVHRGRLDEVFRELTHDAVG